MLIVHNGSESSYYLCFKTEQHQKKSTHPGVHTEVHTDAKSGAEKTTTVAH